MERELINKAISCFWTTTTLDEDLSSLSSSSEASWLEAACRRFFHPWPTFLLRQVLSPSREMQSVPRWAICWPGHIRCPARRQHRPIPRLSSPLRAFSWHLTRYCLSLTPIPLLRFVDRSASPHILNITVLSSPSEFSLPFYCIHYTRLTRSLSIRSYPYYS